MQTHTIRELTSTCVCTSLLSFRPTPIQRIASNRGRSKNLNRSGFAGGWFGWPLVLALVLMVTIYTASAQVTPPSVPDNGPNPSSPFGVAPGASADGANENVSLQNGALSVYIPLLSVPQRGGYSLSLGLVHHSNLNALVQSINIQSSINTDYPGSGGMGVLQDTIQYYDLLGNTQPMLDINLPRLKYSNEWVGDHAYYSDGRITNGTNMFCETNFVFTDWSGNSHPFENKTNCNSSFAGQSGRLVDVSDSSDASFYRLDTTDLTDVKVISKDGTVYHFYGDSKSCPGAGINGGDCSGGWAQYSKRAALIADTNGNQTSITSSGAENNLTYTVTDNLGPLRPITININSTSTTIISVTYKDSVGVSQVISVVATQGDSVTNTLAPSQCGLTSAGSSVAQAPSKINLPIYGATGTVPGSTDMVVTFPSSNGSGAKNYDLTFDQDGRMTEIRYPTGGSSSYAYNGSGGGTGVADQTMGYAHCSYGIAQVSSKSECRDSGNSCASPDVTQYKAVVGVDGAQNVYNTSNTITRPLGDYETHLFQSTGQRRTVELESEIDYYDSLNNPLRTVTKSYPTQTATAQYDFAFPSLVTTTLKDATTSISSSSSYTYDTNLVLLGPGSYTLNIDNPTNTTETDYDGTTKKTTTEQWVAAGGFTLQNYDSDTTNYKSHILDRPSTQTVTDNVNNMTKTTAYAYDGGSNTIANLTSTTVTATNSPSATTSYARNGYGQVTQITDPNANLTTLSYADSWNDSTCAPASSSAYPTSVKNTLNQTVSYKYNSCTGTIYSVTDPNLNATTYTYDAIQRVVQVSLPGGGGQEACYFDSVPVTITNYSLQNGGSTLPTCSLVGATHTGTVVASTVMDGLGRKIQSQLNSDPSGTDFTDTKYDNDGRVFTVSNPYRGSPTNLVTTYGYDALNRKTSQKKSGQFNGKLGIQREHRSLHRRSFEQMAQDQRCSWPTHAGSRA